MLFQNTGKEMSNSVDSMRSLSSENVEIAEKKSGLYDSR